MSSALDSNRLVNWGKLLQLHWPVLFLIILLACIGFAMQYSAAGGSLEPWAKPQIMRFIVGLVALVVISMLPINLLMRFAYLFYFACLVLLVLVEVGGFIGMGAQRWIQLGPITLQPSELMKLGLILALARYFHFCHPEDVSSPMMLVIPALLMILPIMLVLRQPNLGTATILGCIGITIFFLAGVSWRYFVALGLLAAISAPVGWQFLHSYQKQRVLTFLDPSQDPLGAGYNITQSIIAIGSGGLWGKGFLKGSQGQLDFLPEKQTDFIFTMLAEEMGFAGSVGLLLLYGILLSFTIALIVRSRHLFGGLIASGVAALLFVHIFINMAMVMGLIPVVGVPLPLLSYGGTFLLTTMLALGMMMHVYVHRDHDIARSIRPFI
ncbi:MAG: rod shape-determining protein RodA [Rickettsiales bacterium]|nr:rod shape-determining protein RodA [Rickettsiales bacterium]